jgi:acyl-CoA synthetase (AMP-forming)/AMP-acid ligase II
VSTDVNFAATLCGRARAHPQRIALIVPTGRRPGRRLEWHFATYDELASRARQYATGLGRLGVRPGDRVLYLLPPSFEAYAVFYALLRIGAVPVLLDPRMGLRRLLACIESVRPGVMIAVPQVHALRAFFRRPFASSRIHVTAGRRWFWGGVALARCLANDVSMNGAPTDPGDPSFLPFTSGSTGTPKAVFYDHAMLRHQAQIMSEVCGWREAMRVVMCFAPFVPYALADGLTVILPDIDFSRPATADPRRIVDATVTHEAQCAFASPVIWMRVARHCERRGASLPTLERAVTAGAPAPVALHRRLRPSLHQHGQLYTPYGATEAMPLTTAATVELAETWTRTREGYGICIGRPLTGVDLSIIRLTDDAIPVWTDDLRVNDGAIGEIAVDSAVVSPAYPDRRDETAMTKIQRDGRVVHRTGDLGRLDEEGRLWFCGRKAHLINSRRGIVGPVALEGIFNEHPAVFRAAAVGLGSPGLQTAALCVELERGTKFTWALEADILALARGTSFEGLVTRVLPHRGFPVDIRHNSKIRREELAVWAERILRRRAADS